MDELDRSMVDDEGRLRPLWAFLAFHEALRRDVARFCAVLEPEPALDGERLAAFVEHWERFHALLDFHHVTEDTGMFPMLRGARPELAVVIDGLEHEHHQLEGLLERTDATVHAATTGDPVHELPGLFAELEALLLPHLATEEEHLVPAMRAVVAEQIAAGGPGPAGPGGPGASPLLAGPLPPERSVPWLTEHLEPEVLALAVATLPEDEAAAHHGWLTAYRTDLARWIPARTTT
ncbi:hypothetical protein B7486_54095 [cyanobacterium TDX16]|nr:hypothetical protein B7486_54095 [cyanobacterium TDX16]